MAPLPPSETEILFNRHAVALAKSQRLIASWLPPHTTITDEPEERKIAEKAQEELDDAIFTPAPERLGVGAALPKTNGDGDGDGEGLRRREEMAGSEKLKIQLLGRDYAKKMAKGKRTGENGKFGVSTGAGAVGTEKKPRPTKTRREEHDSESEDHEGGRSSLGKSKLGVLQKRRRLEGLEDGVVGDEDGGVKGEKAAAYGLEVRSGVEKRASGYLDEVLSDRARKKRKKGRRKEGAVER